VVSRIINNGDFNITSSVSGLETDKVVLNSNGDISLNGTITTTGYFLNGVAFTGYGSSDVNASNINTGTLSIVTGGTGSNPLTSGQLFICNGTNA